MGKYGVLREVVNMHLAAMDVDSTRSSHTVNPHADWTNMLSGNA